MSDTRDPVLSILNADSPPDVPRLGGKTQLRIEQPSHPLGTLRENLECVPMRIRHYFRYSDDVLIRYAIVKQVAHRIYKHQLGCLPAQRLVQFLRDQSKVKPLFVGMARNSTEPLCKDLCIA